MTGSLWEVEHSYYMTPGNYHAGNCHYPCRSWAEFMENMGESDMDMNYVVRWDWLEDDDFNGDANYRNGSLMIQFVGQRKAALWSYEISVCRADEPHVREWLAPRFAYAMRMWEPFAPPSDGSGQNLADAHPNPTSGA